MDLPISTIATAIGVALNLGGLVWAFAKVTNRVDNNERRGESNESKIERLREDFDREIERHGDALRKDRADTERKREVLHERLAKIEGHLNLMDRQVAVFGQISAPEKLQEHYTYMGGLRELLDHMRRDIDELKVKLK